MKSNISNFYLPLFWKFSIAIVFIVLTFGSINAYLIFQDIQRSLERESEKRALNIGKTLAGQTETPLLFEDYVEVQRLIDDVRNFDSTVIYIFITNKNGNLIAGSYDYRVNKQLISANKVRFDDKVNSVYVDLKDPLGEKKILDIALPILGNELGTLRIGISEERITRDVYKTVSGFWIMVGFFLFVGIIGALLFSLFITKPINSIEEIADNLSLETIAEESLPAIKIRQKMFGLFPFLFRATDEIDLLTDKFNDMIKRLQKTYSELEQAQKKLIESEKLASIGSLSAGIAHEINNPISGIQNAIGRILIHPDNKEQNIKYLNLINQAINRIEHVVKGLLGFARKEVYSFEYISAKKLFEEIDVLIKSKLEANSITFEKFIEPGINSIYCSPNHFQQVLINLILNSIDAINEKGAGDGRIIVSLKMHNSQIKLSIEDNGSGIKKENLQNVFEPFFTTKLKGKGTGLGLAVIHNIVSAHNGEILIESEYGKWTRIDIYLPEAMK